jgi:predicted DNA binding CopG/RHH family protein
MSERIPKFKSEDKERSFWNEADSVDYIDWSEGRKVSFPKLKPSVKTISLRLPEMMLEEIKILANRMDVPYQSLMKIFLAERIDRAMRGKGSPDHGRSSALHDEKGKYGKKSSKT